MICSGRCNPFHVDTQVLVVNLGSRNKTLRFVDNHVLIEAAVHRLQSRGAAGHFT